MSKQFMVSGITTEYSGHGFIHRKIIIEETERVKKEPQWRPAEWPQDAAWPAKEARFRLTCDKESGWGDWTESRLIGAVSNRDGKPLFVSQGLICWEECEVRDE